MGKEFKILCKKQVTCDDSKENKQILHIEGKEYDAWRDEFRNIYTTDEIGMLHLIAGYTEGGIKDQWFIEHFDVVKTE